MAYWGKERFNDMPKIMGDIRLNNSPSNTSLVAFLYFMLFPYRGFLLHIQSSLMLTCLCNYDNYVIDRSTVQKKKLRKKC